MDKLIRMLKFAHAAEIAAYNAYEGHWRSVADQSEQDSIKKIQLDELKHIYSIEAMLKLLQSNPNPILDKMGQYIGEFISFLCFYTGWRLPIWVAGRMECIGTASYMDIAVEAAEQGRHVLAYQLKIMAENEYEHEQYFKNLRRRNE